MPAAERFAFKAVLTVKISPVGNSTDTGTLIGKGRRHRSVVPSNKIRSTAAAPVLIACKAVMCRLRPAPPAVCNGDAVVVVNDICLTGHFFTSFKLLSNGWWRPIERRAVFVKAHV